MVICKLIAKGTEYVSSAVPKLAPASKSIGVGVEIGCEISSEIGKRVVENLKNEETTPTQSLEKFKSTRMSYPDSRQQRNIDSNKKRANFKKLNYIDTDKINIEKIAKYIDYKNRLSKSLHKNYQPKNW